MPAIQIDRLRSQVAALAEHFSQPDRLISSLHDLLDFYANRTLRPGLASTHTPRLPHYNTPLPVLRELERQLTALAAAKDPSEGLRLVDALWRDGSHESRLLAVALLAHVPCPVVEVTARVVRWAQPGEDTHVLAALMEKTKEKLDREAPGAWMQLVEQRLGTTAAGEQSIGLLALRLVIEDPTFENFPAVFRLLSPLVQSPGGPLSQDLARVIQLLAARTP
ncbi:MAG TPA: DNA alkylation repair protein, partial [Anaerolineaceae bacterium]